MDQLTILLCEDDVLIQMDQLDIIAQTAAELAHKFNVISFMDGQGALDHLREHGAERTILITDNNMPHLPGAKLIQTLVADHILPNNVIVCSAATPGQFNEMAAPAQLPESAFVTKPDYDARLAKSLRQAIRNVLN